MDTLSFPKSRPRVLDQEDRPRPVRRGSQG